MQVWARRRKFVVSCVEVENIKGRQPWTRSLAPSRCAISALITVLSTVFRKENMEDSRRILCGFCSPGIAEGSPSAPTNVRLHERPAGCFMPAGLL